MPATGALGNYEAIPAGVRTIHPFGTSAAPSCAEAGKPPAASAIIAPQITTRLATWLRSLARDNWRLDPLQLRSPAISAFPWATTPCFLGKDDVAERILTEPRAEEAITGPAQSADLDVQTVMR